MFLLSREVRFAVNDNDDAQLSAGPTNSFGGFPSLTGLGHYFSLEAAIAGEPDRETGCLLNIKQIDQMVRQRGIPLTADFLRRGQRDPAELLRSLYLTLQSAWPGSELRSLRLRLSPFISFQILSTEHPMVRLSRKFEFSASHRLHNPKLSEEQNRALFGKCNNPNGHGHNYVLEVTLAVQAPRPLEIPAVERIVSTTVIDPFDHKNLNVEIAQFKELIPSVENIAMVIHRMLKTPLETAGAKLAAVTVWETSKTWCEYSE
ncbi:MAG: 6-carboxytetrahydropterin synthase [Tepidisphaeraceae bacterium]|jgi:6-pyruvoyltetrahydropterin/6-carboxytetrahydropterin synthase